MSSTRINFDDIKSCKTNFKLLYVTRSKYGGDWKSIKHSHYFLEFFYLLKGKGNFIIDNETIPVNEKDLIILNPYTEHTEMSLTDNPMEYIVVGVDGLSFNLSSINNNKYIIVNHTDNHEDFVYYFKSLMKEAYQKNADYAIICNNILENFIIKIQRHTSKKFSVIESQKVPKEYSIIKNFIDESFYENITLDSLAQMTHLNKFYLVHTFKKFFGLSPINYLIEKRIMKSKELLKTTNHSISYISLVTGFSSQSYFSQSFKNSTGISPLEYRKSTQ